jgi:hypothetical protein
MPKVVESRGSQRVSAVQPLDMVDNSLILYELVSGQFYLHSVVQVSSSILELPTPICFHLHQFTHCHFTGRPLASFTLKGFILEPAAKDSRAHPALSIVGWFSPLPWLGYVAGSVAAPTSHLALVAARAPLVTIHGDAQNDSKLATIPGGTGVVELVGLWPRCGVLALPPHDGWSDSLVQ